MRAHTSGKRWTTRSSLALALAATLGLLSSNTAYGDDAGAGVRARSPVQMYGKVRVCGTRLCSESGKPVQLKGMSTHGTQWYAHCLTGPALDALAYDWRASVLRVSTYAREGGYASDPRKFTELASRLIDMATARGMYVIVDWHTIHPGDPFQDLDKARAFFRQLAERHKHKRNVIYEIANEPHHVPWATVKRYAEAVIPVIRSRAPDAVILVPTPAWATFGVALGSDERDVVADPLRVGNVMYTFHFYASAAGDPFYSALERVSAKLPVFVTEWGTASWTGWGNDFAKAQKWVDLMARRQIGWTKWSLADNADDLSVYKKGACRAGKFSGTGVLKPSGVWVRERIRG
ncbi:glycoside hydrolase family 5 protein [Streptomyces sp. NPDC093568]|uniref:glycoside hydrolase family 5 protein n=1 Tax=Streptomyces sp. NPDC093568 TaxID=3366041 RepID=UPI0037F716E1